MPIDESHNPWTTRTERKVYDNPWIQVTEYDVLTPAGNPGIYGVVAYKHLAIGIIPVDEADHTWLVGQYRYPLQAYSWEIPEGGGKLNVPPETSARRELAEETGLIPGRLTELLRMHLSNSVSDELAIIYLAADLHQGAAAPEETEELALQRVSVDEAIGRVLRGEITDAMSVAGLLRLQALRQLGS